MFLFPWIIVEPHPGPDLLPVMQLPQILFGTRKINQGQYTLTTLNKNLRTIDIKHRTRCRH